MSRIAYPCAYPPEWRAIRLSPSSIRLVVGGQFFRQIPFMAEGRRVGLDEITAAIDDPSWIQEVSPGVFELRATFVQSSDTSVDVRAPRVTELRLVDLPGVAFAGNRSNARFNGVTVTSWDPTLQAPDANSVDERPFVLYQNASRLDITNSTFQYLGSDRSSSYGVSWRKEGTTGTVTGSRFLYNFFGMYTYEAKDIQFTGNEVAYNASYGIDPHDATTGLVIEGNDVHHNGGHGIIFSRYVADSVVRDNDSYANAGNGIMMDFHSDRNVIEANRVADNAGEGIVSSASADLTIRANEVSGSKVGIRIAHLGADRVRATRNVVRGVETGVKIYDYAGDAQIDRNTVVNASVAGARVDSDGAVLANNTILDSRVGFDARAIVTIDGGVVEARERAVDVSRSGNVSLPSGEFTGGDAGIRVARGGVVTRGSPIVRALDPSTGGGSDARTLSLVGLFLVGTAVALQVAHSLRNRRIPRRVPAPAHVRNLS